MTVFAFCYKGDIYFYDKGAAITELKNKCGENWEAVAKKLCAMTNTHLENGNVLVGYCPEKGSLGLYFSRFLQAVTHIANADLTKELIIDDLCDEYSDDNILTAEPDAPPPDLSNLFINTNAIIYNEQNGIIIPTDLCYYGNCTTATVMITADTKGNIVFGEYSNSYGEGNTFEYFLFEYDSLLDYKEHIFMLAERFGGCELTKENISLSCSPQSYDPLGSFLFKFIYMNMYLSQLNRFICLR